MKTLKDEKIAKLEERVRNLQAIIRHCDSPDCNNPRFDMVLELTKKDGIIKSELSALSEQPDTAQTVRDELLKFYLWKCKNNRFADFENDTHESIIDEYLSSTANHPKETV